MLSPNGMENIPMTHRRASKTPSLAILLVQLVSFIAVKMIAPKTKIGVFPKHFAFPEIKGFYDSRDGTARVLAFFERAKRR